MSALDVEKWLALATQPLPATAPPASEARYAASYEIAEGEVSKVGSLTDQGSANWRKVVEACRDHLTNQSKDILIGCYLARALYEQHQLAGVIAGFKVVATMCDSLWDTMFPPKKRMRARGNAIEWLVDDLVTPFEAWQPNPADRSQLSELVDIIQQLESSLPDKMGDHAPAMGDLRRLLLEKLDSLPEEPKPAPKLETTPEQAASEQAPPDTTENAATPTAVSQPAKPSPAPTATASSAAALAPITGDIANERDCQKAIRQVQDRTRQIADYLRQAKLDSPLAYELNRQATWMNIWQLPHHQNGHTQLMPVPKDKREQYEQMLTNGQFRELIPDIEVSLSKAPFWLDGHRLVAEALQQLGFFEASRAVVIQLGLFLEKYPELTELQFKDETPFADDDTRDWIKTTVNSALSGGGDAANTGASQQEAPWLTAYKDAKELVKQKQIPAALKVFQQGIQQSASGRERTYWQLQQAQFCFDLKKYELACPLLEAIDQQLAENNGYHWDSELTIQTTVMLLKCYKKLSNKDLDKARVEQLQARLCCFDMAAAFDL
ncbi:type VI secretion system protein TssA [Endozoicomonas sp. SM1973]|uniref:Type VI secretion system protein TssA n=1 Tax=Spartinivicinus marinus TaxID=2994442 RepID=A0A853IFJ8_9GAMM|nr:type VI secretion system protein TssA [Spartinivicinus marinus]MCX4027990.1 type VI secretion system protein TssA [Spartinivicinus marinus]NYZ68267.1 type VI secretion system protein TssA [Spartinivicinus marinus]